MVKSLGISSSFVQVIMQKNSTNEESRTKINFGSIAVATPALNKRALETVSQLGLFPKAQELAKIAGNKNFCIVLAQAGRLIDASRRATATMLKRLVNPQQRITTQEVVKAVDLLKARAEYGLIAKLGNEKEDLNFTVGQILREELESQSGGPLTQALADLRYHDKLGRFLDKAIAKNSK